MRITYIFRSPGCEKSIERVFVPIINHIVDSTSDVHICYVWKLRIWPIAIFINIIRFAIKSLQRGTYHITGDVQYVACLMNPSNTILTIHDCVLLHSTDIPKWFRFLVYHFWYRIPLKRLKYITCISETTKNDLISFFPWTKDKIVVIPNPTGDEFQYRHKKFNQDCPRILHIGTRSNKNLERVIEALDGINCELIIVGQLSERQKNLLTEHSICYENKFDISDSEIVKEYELADIISFPSLFEGFGMPIVEGQTIGRPVLTSEREPMKTVAGIGACLVNPESVQSIRLGFLRLINDTEYRNAVSQSGIDNSGNYNILRIIDDYRSIYKQMAAK